MHANLRAKPNSMHVEAGNVKKQLHKRRLLTLVLVHRNPENFTRPKQDSTISVLVDMLISVRAPHRAGGLSISGVDVIVCSCV